MGDSASLPLSVLALVISALALALSAITAWLTLLRRGTVKMTQPTVIFFGSDNPGRPKEDQMPKVFLRTLLFATSKRGRIIENMYVTVSRNETSQHFSIWAYGDKNLVRGSGLFVGETGVEANHHFLPHDDGRNFRFTAGQYRIDVFAQLLGDSAKLRLFTQSLEVTSDLASKLDDVWAGLYFDWGPDSERYIPHVDVKFPTFPLSGAKSQ